MFTPGQQLRVRQRSWRLVRASPVEGGVDVLELESLEAGVIDRLTVLHPLEQVDVVSGRAPSLDRRSLTSHADWASAHRLLAATAVRDAGSLSGARFGRVAVETARNTDERTCIAAVLLEGAAGSHKLTGVICSGVEDDVAATILNSLCFDYALRMRTAGVNVSFTHMHPMPVPSAEVVQDLPHLPTLLAWKERINHISEHEEVWLAIWDANRAIAEAYGLDAADLDHILASFPGMARKRPRFVSYLRSRLADWRDEYPATVERGLLTGKDRASVAAE